MTPSLWRTRKSYLLLLLMAILAFNYTDRFALGLVSQDIKSELHLSDSEIGLLSGIAFSLFYAVMGIPIARWADRGNRVTIIGLTTAVWSAAVALCGVARSFGQLLLIRIVVGVGEAGCMPPASSLIADRFTRLERPRATSLYMQGVSLSLVVGYFVAGWVNQFLGWRAMFVAVGLPGIVLAAVAWSSLPEPRHGMSQTAVMRGEDIPLAVVLRFLWKSPTYRHALYANAVLCLFSYGLLQWTPAFFIRSFGLKTGELGTWIAAVYGSSAILGTYWGGELATRLAPNNEGLQMRGMAIASVIGAVFSAFVYITAVSPNSYWAFAWLGLSNLVSIMINGPLMAVFQTLVPDRMRAMSLAIVMFVENLVGLGLGPWAAGALSDELRPWVGVESLRYALLLLCPGLLWAAWHLWAGSRTVNAAVEAANSSIDWNPSFTKRLHH